MFEAERKQSKDLTVACRRRRPWLLWLGISGEWVGWKGRGGTKKRRAHKSGWVFCLPRPPSMSMGNGWVVKAEMT